METPKTHYRRVQWMKKILQSLEGNEQLIEEIAERFEVLQTRYELEMRKNVYKPKDDVRDNLFDMKG